MFRKHRVLPTVERTDGSAVCTVHEGEPLTLYCSSSHQLLCLKCVFTPDSMILPRSIDSYMELGTADALTRSWLDSEQVKLAELRSTVASSARRCDELVAEATAATADSLDDLSSAGATAAKMVEAATQKMAAGITERRDNYLGRVAVAKEALQMLDQDLSCRAAQLTEAVEIESRVAILTYCRELRPALEVLDACDTLPGPLREENFSACSKICPADVLAAASERDFQKASPNVPGPSSESVAVNAPITESCSKTSISGVESIHVKPPTPPPPPPYPPRVELGLVPQAITRFDTGQKTDGKRGDICQFTDAGKRLLCEVTNLSDIHCDVTRRRTAPKQARLDAVADALEAIQFDGIALNEQLQKENDGSESSKMFGTVHSAALERLLHDARHAARGVDCLVRPFPFPSPHTHPLSLLRSCVHIIQNSSQHMYIGAPHTSGDVLPDH